MIHLNGHQPGHRIPELSDGKAAQRIVAVIAETFGPVDLDDQPARLTQERIYRKICLLPAMLRAFWGSCCGYVETLKAEMASK